MGDVYTVRLEPVGVEFEVEEGETVLNAAFRQGISLPHGCKEGQCSACKCNLIEGDVELMKYSTFALSDGEKEAGGILLCRTIAYSDMEVELLNFDEELLSKSIAVKEYKGQITSVERLTHDIRTLEITLSAPMKFWAGQYADITVTTKTGETITRSFSMANTPEQTEKLQFIIKKYPEGRFSGELDGGGIDVGADVTVARTLRKLLPARRPRRSPDPRRRRLGHVADLVDPARPHRQRREPPGALLLRRPHPGRPVLPRPDPRADRGASATSPSTPFSATPTTTAPGAASAASCTRW